MFAGLQGWHLVIILAVILLLFGAPKLPQLARSVGQSMRIFKSEVKTMKEEDTTEAKGAGIDGTGIAGTGTSTPTGTGSTASSTTPESPTK